MSADESHSEVPCLLSEKMSLCRPPETQQRIRVILLPEYRGAIRTIYGLTRWVSMSALGEHSARPSPSATTWLLRSCFMTLIGVFPGRL